MSVFQNNLLAAAASSAGGGGYTLWGWGNNTNGQLGLGDTTNRSSPVQIGSDTDWLNIFAGGEPEQGHSFAIKSDYSLWAWGKNTSGALGLDDTTARCSPTQVGSLTDWKYLHIGKANVGAVKTDGTLWGWGNQGSEGYLGTGTGTNTTYSSPVQIGSLTTWKNPFQSRTFGFGQKTDNTLWLWGNYSISGGNDNHGNQNSPAQMGSDSVWANMIMGTGSGMAVRTDGTLWGWGYGDKGRIDHGNQTNYSSPVQVGTDTDWSDDETFYLKHACGEKQGRVIKTDGTVWGWGENGKGELGDGTTTDRSSPVQFGGESNWVKIHACQSSRVLMAINDASELWFCGRANEGTSGTGSASINKSSPTQVGTDTDWYAVRSGGASILALRTA